MAASNSGKRDVELKIGVVTEGAERIKALGEQVDRLGQEGKGASEDFRKLTDEVNKLGQQQAAVDALAKVETEVAKTSEQLEQASKAAQDLGTSLAGQADEVARFTEAENKLQGELKSTQDQLRQKVAAQRELKVGLTDVKQGTDEYSATLNKLKQDIATLRNAEDQQKAQLSEASAARREAVQALNAQQTEQDKLAKSAQNLSQKLEQQQGELRQVSTTLSETGVAARNAAEAQTQVDQALQRTAQETLQARNAIDGYKLVVEQARQEELAWANEKAAAEKAAQYRKLIEARNYVEFWEQELRKAAQAERELAEAAQQAAAAQQRLNDAFATTGVRSAAQIREELNRVKTAFAEVRNSGQLSGQGLQDALEKSAVKVRELEAELRKAEGRMTFGDRAKGAFMSLADGANALISKFGALGASVSAVAFAFKPMFDAAIQLDTMRRALTAVTGSATQAEQAIAFLRETARKSGLAVGDISDSFVRFTASARASGLSMRLVEDVFRSTAQAAGTLGLSGDKVSHILDALGQMANKGVVSMEELRQQLGDSLPGALGLMAKGLGITEQQLVKLVESGKLLTADALPGLSKAVTTLASKSGEVDGLRASFNRLKNALTETTQIFADSGAFKAITTTLGLVGAAVVGVYNGFVQMAEGISYVTTVVYELIKAPFTGLKTALDNISKATDESADRIERLRVSYEQLVTGSTKSAEAQNAAADATEAAGNAASAAAAGNNTNAASQQTSAAAATSNAAAQQQAGQAATAGGDAAAAASANWVKLSIAFEELNQKRDKEIKNSEVLAKAAKLEGEARIQLTRIAGDEAAAVNASAEAAQNEADKLAIVAQERAEDVRTREQQKAQLEEEIRLLGDVGGARAKMIEKLDEEIKARKAESEQALQSAEASRQDANAKRIAAETYKDNANRLEELRKTYELTVTTLKILEMQQKQGLATEGQVQAARERAAEAEALYRDAVKDSASAVERKTKALESSRSVVDSQIAVTRAWLQSEEQLAQSVGNMARVLDVRIQQKQLDIKTSEAKIEALQKEIALERTQIAVEEAALKAGDPLLEQKKADLQIRRDKLSIMQAEIEKQKYGITQTRQEVEQMQRRGVAGLQSSKDITSGLDSEIDRREKSVELMEKEAELERKRRGVDKEGFSTDSNGQRIAAELPTWLSIFNQLKGRGLSDTKAREVANEFTDSNGNVQFTNNPGQLKYGGGTGGSISYAVDRAAEKAIRDGSANTEQQSTQTTQSSTTQSSSSSTSGAGGGATYTVNINFGSSQRASIDVASDADARTLVNVIQQLGDASLRAQGI